MNTYDKTSLYEMSYAFMRRFAFIPVKIPEEINIDLLKEYNKYWKIEFDKEIFSNISKLWEIINQFRKIGPAIIEDLLKYVIKTKDYVSSLILYVLPQFEGLVDEKLVDFFKAFKNLNLANNNQLEDLITFILDYFDINKEFF